MIVKVSGVPGHPLASGVMVISATEGELLLLVALNIGMLSVPLAASPFAGMLLVHVKVVPAPTGLEKVVGRVTSPLQYIWSRIELTVGVGFMVMVYVSGVPGHPLAAGVMVISAIAGEMPLLVALKTGMLPVPLVASPFAGMLLVHVNVVPAPTGLETGVASVTSPLQYIWFKIALTVGVGFTVIVKVSGVPTHPLAAGVIVISATEGESPVLVALKNGMLPVPLAARPFAGMLLVHVNVVPAPTGLETGIARVTSPLQYVGSRIELTVGVGFMVMVYVSGVPGHPLA